MLNENKVRHLSNLAGVGYQELQDAINSEKETDIKITKSKSFDDSEYDLLLKNSKKTGYDEGKLAGEEMPVKKGREKLIKKYPDLENTSTKDIEELIDFAIQNTEKNFKGNIDEKLVEKDNVIENLRKSIAEKDELRKAEKQEFFNHKNDSDLENSLGILQFVPPEIVKDEKERSRFVQVEKEKAMLKFKQDYKIDFDEENRRRIIDRKTNNILKDELQNNASLQDVVTKFAKENFFSLKTEKKSGRGGKDSIDGSTHLSEIKSTSDLIDYGVKQGIEKNSSEMDALFTKWKKEKT